MPQYDVQGRVVNRPPGQRAQGVYYNSTAAPTQTAAKPAAAPAIDETAFYDAALARRRRNIAGTARNQLNRGLLTLEGRGLGQSPAALGSLQAGINRDQAGSFDAAQADVYGQQFQSQQQRASEERAFARQKELSDISFQQQAALLKLQKKLQGGGGLWGTLGGLVGTIAGGPIGGAIGGWLSGKLGGGGGGGGQQQATPYPYAQQNQQSQNDWYNFYNGGR